MAGGNEERNRKEVMTAYLFCFIFYINYILESDS